MSSADFADWVLSFAPDFAHLQDAVAVNSYKQLLDATSSTVQLKYLPSITTQNAQLEDDDPAKLVPVSALSSALQAMYSREVRPLQFRIDVMESSLKRLNNQVQALARLNLAQSTCTANYFDAAVAIGSPIQLIVTTNDARGQRIPYGGLDVTLSVWIQQQQQQQQLTTSEWVPISTAISAAALVPVDNGDGTYTCVWVPPAAGTFRVHASINNIELTDEANQLPAPIVVQPLAVPRALTVRLAPVENTLVVQWQTAAVLPFPTQCVVAFAEGVPPQRVTIPAGTIQGELKIANIVALAMSPGVQGVSVAQLDALQISSPSVTDTWQLAGAPTGLSIIPTIQGKLNISWVADMSVCLRLLASNNNNTLILLESETTLPQFSLDPAANGIGGSEVLLTVMASDASIAEDKRDDTTGARVLAPSATSVWIYTTPNPLTSILLSPNAPIALFQDQTLQVRCHLMSLGGVDGETPVPYFWPGMTLHAAFDTDEFATVIEQPVDSGDGHTYITTVRGGVISGEPRQVTLSVQALPSAVTAKTDVVVSHLPVQAVTLTPTFAQLALGASMQLVCALFHDIGASNPLVASDLSLSVTTSNFISRVGQNNILQVGDVVDQHDGTYLITITAVELGNASVAVSLGGAHASTLVTVS